MPTLSGFSMVRPESISAGHGTPALPNVRQLPHRRPSCNPLLHDPDITALCGIFVGSIPRSGSCSRKRGIRPTSCFFGPDPTGRVISCSPNKIFHFHGQHRGPAQSILPFGISTAAKVRATPHIKAIDDLLQSHGDDTPPFTIAITEAETDHRPHIENFVMDRHFLGGVLRRSKQALSIWRKPTKRRISVPRSHAWYRRNRDLGKIRPQWPASRTLLIAGARGC